MHFLHRKCVDVECLEKNDARHVLILNADNLVGTLRYYPALFNTFLVSKIRTGCDKSFPRKILTRSPFFILDCTVSITLLEK